LAGLIDGEGSITAQISRKGKFKLQICPKILIANTNQDIAKWIRKTELFLEVVKFKRKKYKDLYQFYSYGYKILPILKIIQPHLKAKKKQAILLSRFIELRLDRGVTRRPYAKDEIELIRKLIKLNSNNRKALEKLDRYEQLLQYVKKRVGIE